MVTKAVTCLGVWQVLLLVQHWHILWVGSSWLWWIGSMFSIWLVFSHWCGIHFGGTWYMTLLHSTRGYQMLNRSIWNVLLETQLLPARCFRHTKSESNKSFTNLILSWKVSKSNIFSQLLVHTTIINSAVLCFVKSRGLLCEVISFSTSWKYMVSLGNEKLGTYTKLWIWTLNYHPSS